MPQNITIDWFEIPTADLKRAVAFYEAVLETDLVAMDSPAGTIHTFMNGEMPVGALVRNETAQPSASGALIYLHSDDIEATLAHVEAAGGAVILPKTSIGPHGNIAQFTDSENNRIALHSE